MTFRFVTAAFLALWVLPVHAGGHSAETRDAVMTLLRAFGALDVEAQVAAYSEDATIITAERVHRGREDIRAFVEAGVAEFSQRGISMETEAIVFEGNTGLVIWSADSPQNTYEFAADTYVVENGKIVSHTFAARIVPK